MLEDRMMVQMIAYKKDFGQDDVVVGRYGVETGEALFDDFLKLDIRCALSLPQPFPEARNQR